MQKIANRNICAMQYHPIRMILELEFKEDENVYQYFDVPEDVWYAMRNVENIDIFYNTQILYRYKMLCKAKGKRVIT